MSNQKIAVTITPELKKTFRQIKVKGKGGFQSLTKQIQETCKSQSRIVMNKDDLNRIIRYSTDYGHGGYQQAFRFLLALTLKQHQKDLF